ncbi:M1 family metallopeptidase [Bacillus cereus]|nr:M1 family metallopeptidase [Bacillus cereus]
MKKWINIAIVGSILLSLSFFSAPLYADAKEVSNLMDKPQYQIEAELDPQQHRIQASESVSFKNKYMQNLNELVFHLYPDSYNTMETMSDIFPKPTPEVLAKMQEKYPDITAEDFLGDIEITSVTIQGEKVSYTEQEQVLKIQLAKLLQPDECVDVKIDFTVKIPFGSQRMHYRDEIYSITKWYPILAMYDPKTEKWDENPYHPYGESDYSEFSDYKMKLTVPKEMVVAATGTEKESIDQNKKIIQVDAPNVREFAFFVSPHYAKETTDIDGITLNSYYDKRKDNKHFVLGGLNVARDKFEFFNQKFGQYVYPEFDIVETRIEGGNMEYRIEGGDTEYPTIVQLQEYTHQSDHFALVHEIAHQWFYGMIGNNPYCDPALDEGFTIFAHYYSRRPWATGMSKFQLPRTDEIFTKVTGAINRPINQYSNLDDYATSIYSKGHFPLVDLYSKVGENKFDQIMKTYFEQNKFTNATFAKFFDAIDQVVGKEIRDYVEDAFTKPDYNPRHLIQSDNDEEFKFGNGEESDL